MTLKSDLSKFSYIVSFELLFDMTSKLTRVFFAAALLVHGKMWHSVNVSSATGVILDFNAVI